MSLHRYRIDFSSLPLEDKSELIDRIDNCSFNGLFWEGKSQTAEFYVDKDFDVSVLKIPKDCPLSRL